MNVPVQPPRCSLVALDEREERLITTLRLLGPLDPSAWEAVERFVWNLVGEHRKRTHHEPDSAQRELQFMALDPFLKRESDAITEDFAETVGDGLEEEEW